jgi:alkylation response protein AidB-like acyl-CoA dehydrogenase
MNAADLLYSQVEEDLRDTVRQVFRDRCAWTAVLARCEQEQPYDLHLWRTLATDLGLVGLAIPEDYGGSGASTRELAVLAEPSHRFRCWAASWRPQRCWSAQAPRVCRTFCGASPTVPASPPVPSR